MGKVRFLFVSSDMDSIDLFQTYSCDFGGCDKVFSRNYELKKHKAKHEAPERYGHYW